MIRAFLIAAALTAVTMPVAYAACAPGPQPEINITASESEPRFDYWLTQSQLEKFRGNAEVPASAIYDLTVNAMSVGKLQVTHDVKFTTQTMPDKQMCIQVAQVDIHIHLDPAIYIAKELRSEACEYKEYLLHEMKHVEEDRRIIGDYKAIITRNMNFAFPAIADYSVGPVPASIKKDAQEKLSGNITGTLQATVDSMMRERQERQRAIDNTGEYMRLARACTEGGPGVKPSLRKP